MDTSEEHAIFRHIKNIDRLTEDELKKEGYYRGFPCCHGHTIRDTKEHWCYHCVLKIKSNICGFDVNYLDINYKTKYYKLWHHINVKNPDDCWEASLPGKRGLHRVCFPSYRTQYSCQKSENVTAHKAIYQCAWGDIGTMFVTRICGNPWCLNPLHMISRWNRDNFPQKVNPFVLKFDAQKLMRISKAKLLNREHEVIEEKYFKTIKHPLQVKDAPDYDEG